MIANPGFGFQVVGRGRRLHLGENSRENQLTPWSNDPVSDRPGEAIYVRDEDTGELWSPTALPIRDERRATSRATARATAASSTRAHGIALELLQYVPLDDPSRSRA